MFHWDQIISLSNSHIWLYGLDSYKDKALLDKFVFYNWTGDAGVYSALPDWLRKLKPGGLSRLLETDSPSLTAEDPPDPPQDDMASPLAPPPPPGQQWNITDCLYSIPQFIKKLEDTGNIE